jgi:hypothetical protein
MSLDFQSIREQVKQLGSKAVIREQQLRKKYELAAEVLASNDQNLANLRQKVGDVAQNHDPSLRCALPLSEALVASFPLPPLPDEMTVLAADGSQITPDRHAQVNFGLINVGAIQMRRGSSEPPSTTTVSHLLYGEQLHTSSGTITEARLALMRDRSERTILAALANQAPPPVVTFTDGPMELWGGKAGDGQEIIEFQKSLQEYLDALTKLHEMGVITAGYVDKPSANLVVRTLEVAIASQAELSEIRTFRPLAGVTDISLYQDLLPAGDRSALFAIQSQSAKSYTGLLALHFFYLNVGRTSAPYLARVEIPAWVAGDQSMLDNLHATLIEQVRTMGARPYPYLLHRAHETAVVSFQEKDQVTQMIAQELRAQGVQVDHLSAKQYSKQLEGRTRM